MWLKDINIYIYMVYIDRTIWIDKIHKSFFRSKDSGAFWRTAIHFLILTEISGISNANC